MRLSTCIAASFALLSVAVTPLAANAQFQSQSQSRPRPLTSEESNFVRLFDLTMEGENNSLVRMVTDWGKADDGQMVCTALKLGDSVENIHNRLIERSLQITDPTIQQEFMGYSNGILVGSTRALCPEYHGALREYINSSN
jgi:hypothetical protein